MYVCFYHIFDQLGNLVEESFAFHFTCIIHYDANLLIFKNRLDILRGHFRKVKTNYFCLDFRIIILRFLGNFFKISRGSGNKHKIEPCFCKLKCIVTSNSFRRSSNYCPFSFAKCVLKTLVIVFSLQILERLCESVKLSANLVQTNTVNDFLYFPHF